MVEGAEVVGVKTASRTKNWRWLMAAVGSIVAARKRRECEAHDEESAAAAVGETRAHRTDAPIVVVGRNPACYCFSSPHRAVTGVAVCLGPIPQHRGRLWESHRAAASAPSLRTD
ncbi:hypothetical protein GUJ93_ZPchr0009g1209 [Zizania palustris]|uniref:Uncharacterized protein n=1 Tax=Zizania palustris TaxID=103762 RepID=A0A8J5RQC0_ZIZPA|nr:hypothetical protein GUJ93_ZPchr0009g1209 [Zizania palustris]